MLKNTKYTKKETKNRGKKMIKKYKDALKRLKENNYLIYDNRLKDIVLLEKAIEELEESKVCFEELKKIIEFNIDLDPDSNEEPRCMGVIEFRSIYCHDEIEIFDDELILLFQKFIY